MKRYFILSLIIILLLSGCNKIDLEYVIPSLQELNNFLLEKDYELISKIERENYYIVLLKNSELNGIGTISKLKNKNEFGYSFSMTPNKDSKSINIYVDNYEPYIAFLITEDKLIESINHYTIYFNNSSTSQLFNKQRGEIILFNTNDILQRIVFYDNLDNVLYEEYLNTK